MPAPLRVFVAVAVLMAGIACAALFRQDHRNPPPSAESHASEPAAGTVEVGPINPTKTTQPSLRNQLGGSGSPFRYIPRSNMSEGESQPASLSQAPEPVLPKSEQRSESKASRPPSSRAATPVPSMAPKFPQFSELRPNRVGDLPPTSATRSDQRTHRVVDGDTFETIAERYFGSAEHAIAIREANTEVLPDSNVLPIGIELLIPQLPAGRATSEAAAPPSASKKPATRGQTDLNAPASGAMVPGESAANRSEGPLPKQTPAASGQPAAIVWPPSHSFADPRNERRPEPAVNGWEPAAR